MGLMEMIQHLMKMYQQLSANEVILKNHRTRYR
jgi:hypothetical protein